MDISSHRGRRLLWCGAVLVVACGIYVSAYAALIDRGRGRLGFIGNQLAWYRSSYRWAPPLTFVSHWDLVTPSFASQFEPVANVVFIPIDWLYWRLRGEPWRQVLWAVEPASPTSAP